MASLYFGGTFNPIHHGHLLCSRSAAEAKGFEKVILMPTGQSPHKPNAANMAEAGDRLAMCQLAVAGDANFAVDDSEIRRNGPSFTLDTVRALKARGEKEVFWLIGADMLLYLPKWHRPEELLEEVNFIVMARTGWEIKWDLLPAAFDKLEDSIVSVPLLQVSGTEIRERAARGKSIDYLSPPAVCRYIRDKGLYGSK